MACNGAFKGSISLLVMIVSSTENHRFEKYRLACPKTMVHTKKNCRDLYCPWKFGFSNDVLSGLMPLSPS